MALKIPAMITSRKELVKLRREIERFRDALIQQRVARDKAAQERDLPPVSAMLRHLLEANSVKITENNMQKMQTALEYIFEHAPQVRMAFASEPDTESLQKLVEWFRQNTDPHMFIQVGIQPMLAGGAVLRTPRKRYDFSIRTALMSQTDKLMEAMQVVSQQKV